MLHTVGSCLELDQVIAVTNYIERRDNIGAARYRILRKVCISQRQYFNTGLERRLGLVLDVSSESLKHWRVISNGYRWRLVWRDADEGKEAARAIDTFLFERTLTGGKMACVLLGMGGRP